MSSTNDFFTQYGVKTELELFQKKTSDKEIQYKEMPTSFKPALVKITADKCKELCEKSFLEYMPGYENRVIERIVTTEACDRDGDIVRAKGINNQQYRKNPVVLFAHEKSSTPVGNSIKEWLDKDINGWRSWDLYLDNSVDTSGRSDLIFRLIKSGAMPGASIGFLPLKAKYDHTPEDRKAIGLGKYGVEYLSINKLEHSACSVPANQEALSLHLKSLDRAMVLNDLSKSDTGILEKMFDQKIVELIETILLKTEKTISLPDFNLPEDIILKKSVDEDEEKLEVDDVTKPYPNEHAARVREPGDFKSDSFRRKKVETGINIIMGKLTDGGDTMITQSYRFDSSKYSASEAKKWLTDHKIKYIKFEAASGKEEENTSNTIINLSLPVDAVLVELQKVNQKIVELKTSTDAIEKALTDKCEELITKLEKAVSSIEYKHKSKALYDVAEVEEILKL